MRNGPVATIALKVGDEVPGNLHPCEVMVAERFGIGFGVGDGRIDGGAGRDRLSGGAGADRLNIDFVPASGSNLPISLVFYRTRTMPGFGGVLKSYTP